MGFMQSMELMLVQAGGVTNPAILNQLVSNKNASWLASLSPTASTFQQTLTNQTTLTPPTPPTPPANPLDPVQAQNYNAAMVTYNQKYQAYNTQLISLMMQRMQMMTMQAQQAASNPQPQPPTVSSGSGSSLLD